MEIKIPKEVRKHQETIFFGLSARQFFCSVVAVGLSVFVYLCLNSKVGKETAGWFCILAAAPVAVSGFFHFNGMTLEQFLWAVIKSQILCAKPRHFVSENFYYVCLGRKERDDFD